MKNKRIIICAGIVVAILLISLGAFWFVNSTRNKQIKEALKLVEQYSSDFNSKTDMEEKEKMYSKFSSDEQLNGMAKNYENDKSSKYQKFYEEYSLRNKEMYDWFFKEYEKEFGSIAKTDEKTTDLNAARDSNSKIEKLIKRVNKSKALKSADKKKLVNKFKKAVIDEKKIYENLAAGYSKSFTEISGLINEKSNKADYQNAINKLNELEGTIDKNNAAFADIVKNIDSKKSEYQSKVKEFEEKEKKAITSNNSVKLNNNSNANNSNNKSSSSNSKVTVIHPGTGEEWVMPQPVRDAKAKGHGGSYFWDPDGNGGFVCRWYIHGGNYPVYVADQAGNILGTEWY